MVFCELSLLEIGSGLFFFKALRLMKEKQFVPKSVNDIGKFVDIHFIIGFIIHITQVFSKDSRGGLHLITRSGLRTTI